MLILFVYVGCIGRSSLLLLSHFLFFFGGKKDSINLPEHTLDKQSQWTSFRITVPGIRKPFAVLQMMSLLLCFLWPRRNLRRIAHRSIEPGTDTRAANGAHLDRRCRTKPRRWWWRWRWWCFPTETSPVVVLPC